MACLSSDSSGDEDDLKTEILSELNEQFENSKAELIRRFLRDQEELNCRFEEYELTNDQSGSKLADLSHPQVPPCSEPGKGRDGQDDIDNLSVISAVNSSDRDSLSDTGYQQDETADTLLHNRIAKNKLIDTTEEQFNSKMKYNKDFAYKISDGVDMRQITGEMLQNESYLKHRVSQKQPRRKKLLTKKSTRPQTALEIQRPRTFIVKPLDTPSSATVIRSQVPTRCRTSYPGRRKASWMPNSMNMSSVSLVSTVTENKLNITPRVNNSLHNTIHYRYQQSSLSNENISQQNESVLSVGNDGKRSHHRHHIKHDLNEGDQRHLYHNPNSSLILQDGVTRSRHSDRPIEISQRQRVTLVKLPPIATARCQRSDEGNLVDNSSARGVHQTTEFLAR